MALGIHVNTFNQEQWEQHANLFLDHNLYQTWAYQHARIDKFCLGVDTIDIVDENGDSCIIAIVRIMRIPIFNLKVGYVQWGPLIRRTGQAARINPDALRLVKDYYIPKRVDIFRIAPNVFVDEVEAKYDEALEAAGFKRVNRIRPYHTMLFPLDITEDQMRNMLHSKWRGFLRKAEEKRMDLFESQDLNYLYRFEEIYQEAIHRKHFKGLNIQEFIRTQEHLLDDQKINMLVVNKDGIILSIDINSYLGDTSLGLFQATSEQGLSLGASYLIWWNTFLAAKRAGMRRYDMGGIDPEKNPSVYQYKRRMGGNEAFHIGSYDVYGNAFAKYAFYILDLMNSARKRK
jgi:hypothetical protein